MWYGPGDLVPKRRRTGVKTSNDSLRAVPSVALAPAAPSLAGPLAPQPPEAMPATDSSIGVRGVVFVIWVASAVQSPNAVPGSMASADIHQLKYSTSSDVSWRWLGLGPTAFPHLLFKSAFATRSRF